MARHARRSSELRLADRTSERPEAQRAWRLRAPATTWRTRPDPFVDVWADHIEPLLVADEDRKLEAKTIFETLCERHPGKFEPGQLRTLQRRVRKWSTINLSGRIYSVPARLIGHTVEARVFADVVEVRFNDKLLETMPRIRGEKGHRIDYRHVISSLVRKPGAFRRVPIPRGPIPLARFRRAYDALGALEVTARTWSMSASCISLRARRRGRSRPLSRQRSRAARRSTTPRSRRAIAPASKGMTLEVPGFPPPQSTSNGMGHCALITELQLRKEDPNERSGARATSTE